jgi:hypothetical protein
MVIRVASSSFARAVMKASRFAGASPSGITAFAIPGPSFSVRAVLKMAVTVGV